MLIPTSACEACIRKECEIIQRHLDKGIYEITIICPGYLAKDLKVKFHGYDSCDFLFYDSVDLTGSPLIDFGKDSIFQANRRKGSSRYVYSRSCISGIF